MADAVERRSSSRQPSAQEDKPASRSSSHHEEGLAKGTEGGGGGGGGASKKKCGWMWIFAIDSLLITLLGVGLSIWCSLLWWDWPFVITIPALSLGIAALVLAFAAPSHRDALICCCVLADLFALAGAVWCGTEIAMCYFYQGALVWGDEHSSLPDLKAISTDLEALEDLNKYEKAKFYHDYAGELCSGKCYDWSYRKEWLIMKAECQQASEKWFLDKHFKNGAGYKSCSFDDAYSRVDSYHESPIYQTHEAIADNNRAYPSNGLYSKSTLKAALKKICKDFDVKEFVKRREKCDKKLKKKFDPECSKERHGVYFMKGKSGGSSDCQVGESPYAGCQVLDEVEECHKADEYSRVYEHSKYYKAMGSPSTPRFAEDPSNKIDVDQDFRHYCEKISSVDGLLNPDNLKPNNWNPDNPMNPSDPFG